MNLLTLDIETTMNAPKELGEAHPMFPGNSIVLLVTKTDYPLTSGSIVKTHKDLHGTALYSDIVESKPDFIVGCNISFDLLYLYRYAAGLKTLLQEQRLWDIQLAEYLLTGQQSKWASLDEMSLKYGFDVKDDAVARYFAAGIGSDKIPMELLEPYCRQDVENTEGIARIQTAKAVEQGQMDLIISQMEALHCTTEMMFNGLAIDFDYFKEYTTKVANSYADIKIDLEASLKSKDLESYYPVDDIGSATQWSKFLFGGTKKTTIAEPVGVYKNGKTKFKNKIVESTTPPACEIVPPDDWKSEKTGKVSVDEKVLKVLVGACKSKPIVKILESLLAYRETSKQLSTYIQGLGKHIQPIGNETTGIRYVVHGKLNHVATATGRLSSTNPNLQNISNNPIKTAFVSRYGSNGVLVEFDFNQLEVAVLAHVTRDKQLIADISGGKDIHSELFFDMNKRYPDDAERKWFKRLTFGLIYGAGATTLAENAGCDYGVAKKFISTFYNRYPSVEIWNTMMASEADVRGTHGISVGGLYSYTRHWTHISETGRRYVFNEYKSTYGDRAYTFSPTELKNYPVQGLATGDIVPMMLGILFRKLIKDTGVYLVNTVHDSIMLDVHVTALDEVIKEVRDTLNNTHVYYKQTFGIPLALKLTAGCSVGPNWFSTEKV